MYIWALSRCTHIIIRLFDIHSLASQCLLLVIYCRYLMQVNIQKTKIMASGPITSWEIDGKTVETVSGFILGGSKITADGDCSHEIKRRSTEDEMAGWYHQLDGHEFGWTPGVGDGQGGLACSNSWGCKESDTTEQLNWTELNWIVISGYVF